MYLCSAALHEGKAAVNMQSDVLSNMHTHANLITLLVCPIQNEKEAIHN